MKKFATTLTAGQMQEARRFESAGLTTISQAVKAFERGDSQQIAQWKQQLQAKEQQ